MVYSLYKYNKLSNLSSNILCYIFTIKWKRFLDWYWSFLSCINYTACNTASAGGNKCVATDYSEYNQPVSKYSRSTTNNWISDMNCDSTGLGYKTQSGHYHYPVITYMGSINYKACNLGSVYTNVTNDETSVKMTGQNRFKYYSTLYHVILILMVVHYHHL